jgi:small conductance mechanosensitive channel
MDEQLKLIDRVSDMAVDMAMRFAPKLFVALLILAAGYLFGRWAGRALARGLASFDLEPPVRMLLQRMTQILCVGLFLVLALQNLGIELLPLIAGLGIVGAGIALAMQGVLGNAAAGLTIIFTRPFRVGDYISIAGVEGEVLDISIFNTTLGHGDRSQVVVPNRKISGEILHNYRRTRQLALEVGVSYGTDIDAAVRAIREVLGDNERVLEEPRAAVGVAKLADSRVVIGVGPWVRAGDYGAAAGELNKAIVEALRARGIEIALPQREIRVLSGTASVRQGADEVFAGRNAA